MKQSDTKTRVESSGQLTGSVPNRDQAALNTVAAAMRKTAMELASAKDNSRLMLASVLLAKAIEKEAGRIGANGLMKQND